MYLLIERPTGPSGPAGRHAADVGGPGYRPEGFRFPHIDPLADGSLRLVQLELGDILL